MFILKARMLETYLLFLGQCLKDVTKFWTLDENNTMNLFITLCSLSPFKTSTSKRLERKVLLAANAMANVVAFDVQATSSWTRDLTCSTIFWSNLLSLNDHVYLNESLLKSNSPTCA
jgi:hypothetical protein